MSGLTDDPRNLQRKSVGVGKGKWGNRLFLLILRGTEPVGAGVKQARILSGMAE